MQLSVTQSQNKISLLKMNIVSREMHPLCLLEAEGFYELMAIVEHMYKPPSQLKSDTRRTWRVQHVEEVVVTTDLYFIITCYCMEK